MKAILALALTLVACGAAASSGYDDTGANVQGDPVDASFPADGGEPGDASVAAPSDASLPVADATMTTPPACGAPVCTAHDEIATCSTTGGATTWTRTKCGAGEGCVRGACVTNACSDDCEPGSSGCKLWSASSEATLDTTTMHDKARAFEKWLRRDSQCLLHDQIVWTNFTDTQLTTPNYFYIGDSALHSGIYLAAEAHRLMATGAWDARTKVRDLVSMYHVLFNISGDPGMMATSAFPANDPNVRTNTFWDCAAFDRHCNVTYDGKTWDYVGQPSKDMYMGPLLGLVAAYDALGEFDEEYRKVVRQDVMTWAKELVKLRQLQVEVVIDNLSTGLQTVQTRFFIPETADRVNGRIQIRLKLSGGFGGEVRGGREFLPNMGALVGQLAGLSYLSNIPRSSSALMVGGILQAALHVSDGDPTWAADRAALKAFYDTNTDTFGKATDWIAIAATMGTTDPSCTAAYFGLDLAWIAAYTWGRLETDPGVRQLLLSNVIDGKLWPNVRDHKNSFFSFAYGAVSNGGLTGTPLGDAKNQVSGFPAPPRVHVARTGGCEDHAAEIGARPVYYDTWHDNPWLTQDVGMPTQTFPGHDYLLAYWMGRTGGFIADDTPNRCMHP